MRGSFPWRQAPDRERPGRLIDDRGKGPDPGNAETKHSRLEIGPARDADDEALADVFRAEGFPGRLSVRFLREPSPLASFRRDGEEARIATLREARSGRVVGLGGAIMRREFVGGVPRRTAYLTGLKILPAYRRRGGALGRAYAFLGRWLEDADACYTTILEENIPARRLLEKPRRSLPAYRLLGRYTTYCFLAGTGGGRNGRSAAPELIRGDVRGVDALFPTWFSGFDLAPASRRLHGLADGDFQVLRDGGGALLAACAVYDQQAWKQYQMCAYGGLYRAAALLPARLFGYPPFPRPGAMLNYASIVFPYVKDGDPELGRRFLRAVAAADRRHDMLLLGLFETHPLNAALQGMKTLRYHSRVYEVSWTGRAELSRSIHMEAALL